MSINSSPPSLSVRYCSISAHQSVQKLENYRLISRLKPKLHSRSNLGRPLLIIRRMHTPNFGLYQFLSISSVCNTLFHDCESIRSEVRNLPHNWQTKNHITHNWEGCCRLSVECTPPTLVSIYSSPSLCLLNFVP